MIRCLELRLQQSAENLITLAYFWPIPFHTAELFSQSNFTRFVHKQTREINEM